VLLKREGPLPELRWRRNDTAGSVSATDLPHATAFPSWQPSACPVWCPGNVHGAPFARPPAKPFRTSFTCSHRLRGCLAPTRLPFGPTA